MNFADIHCHPALFTFNRHRNTPVEEDPEQFHPWSSAKIDKGTRARGGRATRYSQCDLPALDQAGARLIFASITPIEVGFFVGVPEPGRDSSFPIELLKLLSGVTLARALGRLARGDEPGALRLATGILRNRGPVRLWLQRTVIGYPRPRLDFMLSEKFDYWDEFERECRYFKSRDGVATPYTTHAGESAVGRYDLVRSGPHLDELREHPDAPLALIFSIEGGHVFSMGPGEERVPDELIFERIKRLKEWPHPILFITLAHHFDNGICGHARSLVDIASHLMDQRERLYRGLEREGDLGLRVVRALYDLDGNLEDLGGRRVLIDAKHLSPLTRKQLYAEVLEPVAARAAEGRGRTIPLIFSHVGYSGVPTLDEHIGSALEEDDNFFAGEFNAWGINVCDEDLRMVHRTGGMLGICLDRRIAGVRPKAKPGPEEAGDIVAKQIFAMIDIMQADFKSGSAEYLAAWDTMCLGSDYDGVIDPIPGYETAETLPRLRDDLAERLAAAQASRGIAEIGVDELVEKICWRNAYEFARRELPQG